MKLPRIFRDRTGTVWVERFGPHRLAEHWIAVVTFVALVLTGFPQKFYEAEWAQWIITVLGGLPTTRLIHRIAGWVFTFHAVVHILAVVVGLLTGRMRMTLFPTTSDLRDLWHTLAYDLGFRKDLPALPKFDYRQKFEYVGLVLGGLVMVASGLILLEPGIAASFLPGEVIPAARVAHSNEALLALLVLLIWHIYGAVLSPSVFPLDKVILTGRMTAEELHHEHGKEYAALFGDTPLEELEAVPETDASLLPSPEPPAASSPPLPAPDPAE